MATYITRTIQQGFPSGLAIALGVTTIEFGYYALSALSLSLIDPAVVQASYTIKAFAAAYLIFLGVRGFIQLRRGPVNLFGSQKKWLTLLENFLMGITVTLSNPYTFLFYATVVPTILNMNGATTPFLTGLVIVSGVGLLCRLAIITLAHQAREILADSKFIEVVNVITSVVFIGIGLFLAFSLLPVFVPTLFG